MPYMYILECSDKTFYTGSTWNLTKRFQQHSMGKGANYTRKRLPVKLIYSEYYPRIVDAFRREKQVQNWGQQKKIALINSNYEKLTKLSQCKKR